MKRNLKVIVSLLLVCLFMFMSFGCGGLDYEEDVGEKISSDFDLKGEQAENDEKTIEVYLYSAGFGVNWFNDIGHKFIELFPEYKIVCQEQSTSETLRKKLSTGPKFTADLIITGDSINGLLAQGSSIYSGYPIIFESIDDLYNQVPVTDNGATTILQKMNDAVAESYKQKVSINNKKETHYYSMPWVNSYSGLYYNSSLFADAGLTYAPRTTNELLNFCNALVNNIPKIDPIIMSSADDYIQYLSWVWWAQYEGQEGISNFYNCKEDSEAFPSTNGKIFDQNGYYEMFKVYEELLQDKFVNDYCESFDAFNAQKYFLRGDKTKLEHGAIMPNGNWLENEMNSSATEETITNILPMETPIISAIVDKLSFWNEATTYSKANLTSQKKNEYDQILCSIIDYVKGKTQTKPAGVTDDDIDFVRQACFYYTGGTATMAIPVFATAKEGAKKFMSFMASNMAIDLYFRATKGCTLPYKYDYKTNDYYNGLSNFSKKNYELLLNKNNILTENSYITFYKGGFQYDRGLNNFNFALTFGSRDSATRLTADQVLQNEKNFYKSATLESILKSCGLMV